VVEDFTEIIDELMAWYVREAIPTYRPPNPRVEVEATSVSGSTLCHVSVARWCKASGFEVDSPQRRERCARLTGQVAAEAVRRPVPHRGRGGRERQGEDGLLPVPQEARDVKWNGERG